MKQKKGRDYKATRQWTNEDREMKKRLMQSVEAGIIKGEFEEEKLISSLPEKESKK
ncbi:MAG: hypothetical protein FWC97_00880 [Treponema sp.]|nr:hypothetical protein [Treponema sp.]